MPKKKKNYHVMPVLQKENEVKDGGGSKSHACSR